jgi:methionyl-tRNA formyltransferase
VIIFLGIDRALKLYNNKISSSVDDNDIVLSCQYGYKIPQSLIKSHICVNVHYGLLPFFAGCNPIYWQMIKSKTVGVTLHYVDTEFDSGDIIDTYEFPHYSFTADEVYDECERVGLMLFKKHYKGILDGTAPRKKQDLTFRKYYKKDAVDFCSAKKRWEGNNEFRAVYFEGKQYPMVNIDGRYYELHKV